MKKGWRFYYEEMEAHRETATRYLQRLDEFRTLPTEVVDQLPLHILQIIQDGLKDTDCAVCLEPVLDNFFLTHCGHHYHKPCVRNLLFCPLCRESFTARELNQLQA